MRDFRDAKLMAQALRKAIKDDGLELSHSRCLEIVARELGYDDWNILAAKIAAEPPPEAVRFDQIVPVVRIFDIDKAKAFYLDYLGFSWDWEHRFEPNLPLYAQISRAGMVLHLSEHYGDGSPGTVIFAWTSGVEAFHREISAKGYTYLRPGLNDHDWGLELQVHDPFGNRIRFTERKPT
jgi:predicted enzyme related to lactoylglutathione lyase